MSLLTVRPSWHGYISLAGALVSRRHFRSISVNVEAWTVFFIVPPLKYRILTLDTSRRGHGGHVQVDSIVNNVNLNFIPLPLPAIQLVVWAQVSPLLPPNPSFDKRHCVHVLSRFTPCKCPSP